MSSCPNERLLKGRLDPFAILSVKDRSLRITVVHLVYAAAGNYLSALKVELDFDNLNG